MSNWSAIQEWIQSNFNGLDAVYFALLLVYAIRGLVRGLSAELAGAIGFSLLLMGGWKLYSPLSDWLQAHTRLNNLESANLLALIASIVVLATVLGLIKLALRNLFKTAFEGTPERLGGLLAGLLKGFVICALFVFAIRLSGHAYLNEHVVARSQFGTFVAERLPGWYWAIRDRIVPREKPEGDDQIPCEPEPGAPVPAAGAPGKR